MLEAMGPILLLMNKFPSVKLPLLLNRPILLQIVIFNNECSSL